MVRIADLLSSHQPEQFEDFGDTQLIQTVLALHDEYERRRERSERGDISQEASPPLLEGESDRAFALHTIHRGALQVAASGLIGQDTQQRAGESELHRCTGG
ncbi:hypothetical protein ACVW1C_000070 [Bradyrhizobium sp. USDA 4011]